VSENPSGQNEDASVEEIAAVSDAANVVENTEDGEAQPTDNQLSGAAARREQPELSLKLALAAAQTAAENGGTDILVLDMTDHTAIFDYFVIATGTSRRQLHAISEDIDDKLEKELNDKRMNIDGYDESRWIVLDYGTVVIHLFDEDTRQFYSLEALWADAKKVDLTETLKNVRQ
jgi:ribosome-associated protein